MTRNEMQSNLSTDREHYRTKDAYKVALLECFGAKSKVIDDSDPEVIVFECYYPYKNEDDCLAAFINRIHSGEPSEVSAFAENLRNIFRIIRDTKLNRKQQQSVKEEVVDAKH